MDTPATAHPQRLLVPVMTIVLALMHEVVTLAAIRDTLRDIAVLLG